MRKASNCSLPLCAVLIWGLASVPASAQITPDATLPSNSIVLPDGNRFTIEGGTEAGSNLFHSFEEFSIPTGGEAFFNNALTIDNIITRVTGGTISNIDGLIRANGAASLFLLNPNGIVFGPNARLDIGGSFLGSTADSVLFEDGSVFSATEANAPPLLTINVPVGLQMGTNLGAITVRGSGYNITADDPVFSPYVLAQPNSELKVRSGNTIALVGGDINLEGGVLTAESGRIDLTAIGNNSVAAPIVNLRNTSSGWRIDAVEVEQFGDIFLSQASLIDASGTGSIQLQGRKISLRDGSLALIQNTTSAAAGDITIRAVQGLQLEGMSANGEIRSGLENQTVAAGNAGGIQVFAADVMINDGAAIFARSFSTGATDDIVINASGKIQVAGFSLLNPGSNANSSIINFSLDRGNSGNLKISTNELILTDAGSIGTATFGQGNARQLTVNVNNFIDISGFNPITESASSLFSSTFGMGESGNSTIDTGQLILSRLGRITTGSFATGKAGNVVVNASELIEISGGERTSIDSSVDVVPEVVRSIFRLPDVPSGSAGSVTLNTPVLRVTDEANVSVRNEGVGNAGSLQINADRLELNHQGVISASTMFGEGGNITLQTQNLQLRNSSSITATSGGSGNGGNITIDSPTIALLENSEIVANAFQGTGGNIEITTSGLFVSPDSNITASSQFGVDGTVNVNNPIVDPASGLVTLNADTLNPNTQIQDSCDIATRSRFAITGNGGLPPDPTQPFLGQTVWRDTRLDEIQSHLVPNPTETESETTSVSPVPLVEATGWRRNDRGQIELVAASGNTSYSSWQSHPECDRVSQDSLEPDFSVR